MKTPFLLVVVISSLAFCNLSEAQVNDSQRAQRRALVEDLLRGLLDSQTQPKGASPGGQPQYVPGGQSRPRPPRYIPGPGGIVIAVSPEMKDARKQIRSWQVSCEKLVDELRFHEHESPQLRPLLADAMKIQAAVNALNNKAQLYPTLNPLVNDFGAIDRDWRVLSHRLQQVDGLTPKCRTLVTSIAEMDTQLCSLFGIQPQIDRQELVRLTTELNSHFKHLLQDVYYQMRGKPKGKMIMQQGQELYSRINQSSSLIPRGSYDSIVKAYRDCNTQWRYFSRQLRAVTDQRIRRDIQEIELLGRQIHEQLWLPVEMDRDYVTHLMTSIQQDAALLFDTVSLNQLMTCQQPNAVIRSVKEFQNSCASFTESIASGKSPDKLAWDFKRFEKQWNGVQKPFREFQDNEVNYQLDEINYTMTTLQETFGRGIEIDHQSLVQIAANLDQLCQELSIDIHRRIHRRRYDKRFHDSICDQADTLHDAVHDFHRGIISHRSGGIDRKQLSGVFHHWKALKQMMNKCQPKDQAELLKIRRQIEPLMVKLQLVFAG